jgi:hypothetical protein
MIAALTADLVLLIHLGFILFVGIGGLLALRWHHLAWLHLPAVIWGAAIELHGSIICPLTPLEIDLRHAAGQAGYEGGFIGHYLVPLVYPPGLTPSIQVLIGVCVIVLNLVVYAYLLLHRRRDAGRRRRHRDR